jgi:outer membrane protein TolC
MIMHTIYKYILNKITHLLVLIFLIVPGIIQSQNVLSLKDVISTALENNYSISISRNQQKISDNNVTPGNAGMLPSVDLSAGYSGTTNNTSQFPADGSATIVNNSVNNTTLNAGVNLNWTIFNGFGMFVNYQRLKELRQAGELNTKLAVENLVVDITSEYFNFVQQTIRLQNLKSAVKLSKERLRIVEARYNIGSLSKLDLQQARVDFNADSSKLIRQYEVLFTSRVKLNRLMSVDKIEFEISVADTAIVYDALLSKNLLWEQTLAQNVFLQISENEKKLGILELKAAQSKNYPYVKLTAGYGYTQNRYEIASYRRQDYLGPNFGITLGYNLFDGFNRNREQRNARIQIENKNLLYNELLLSLQGDFANIWMAYQNNIKLTALERENVNTAVENYEIAIDRYMLGDLSGIQLREAQNSLLEAKERLVQAEYNTKLCEISLLQISGNLSQYLK